MNLKHLYYCLLGDLTCWLAFISTTSLQPILLYGPCQRVLTKNIGKDGDIINIHKHKNIFKNAFHSLWRHHSRGCGNKENSIRFSRVSMYTEDSCHHKKSQENTQNFKAALPAHVCLWQDKSTLPGFHFCQILVVAGAEDMVWWTLT